MSAAEAPAAIVVAPLGERVQLALLGETQLEQALLGRTLPGQTELGQTPFGQEGSAPAASAPTAGRLEVDAAEFPRIVDDLERRFAPRWVWFDTASTAGELLREGVRVARCHDLRLARAILREAREVPAEHAREFARHPAWDAPAPAPSGVGGAAEALFELGGEQAGTRGLDAACAEFARQRAAIAASARPAALRLLIAAESAGALVAAELHAAGLPWSVEVHERLLEDALGARSFGTPALLAAAAGRVREALGDPQLSVDSQPKLLRALHRAGVDATSTARWELRRFDHPAIAAILEYKKLSRLYAANGWAWIDEWVHDGRFRPVYVPGGVVTGRWSSQGGGALQLPRALRVAVQSDPGWTFVIADVAQLEPRVLAALAHDRGLAAAARGRDLYDGIVASGAVPSRPQAKIAMLGAIYGATTGESAELLPMLRRAYPRAMGFVEDAARAGERGERVATLLGRTSPGAGERFARAQRAAMEADASGDDERLARSRARDRGRFTRNFVVQGTAAEWALAWLAELRLRLAAFPPVPDAEAAPRSGPALAHRPHLSLFLHDEIIVHTPARHAEAVAQAVADAAASAGSLLFGDMPIDFRLDTRISTTASKS